MDQAMADKLAHDKLTRDGLALDKLKIDKLRLETLGGIACMLLGLSLLYFLITDLLHGETMWMVWLGAMVLIVGNGFAMVRHARPLAALRREGTAR